MSDVQMLPALASLSALVLCACGRGHLCFSQVCMAGNVATPECTGRIRCLPAGVAIRGRPWWNSAGLAKRFALDLGCPQRQGGLPHSCLPQRVL